MARRIKIFGERNTGTRAVKQMLCRAPHLTLQQGSLALEKRDASWCQLHEAVNLYYQDDWRRLYMDALRDDGRQDSDQIFAWKHAAPDWSMGYLKHQIDVIFMLRNPYSWALSTACKPYHIKGPRTSDFTKFITRPWLTERRDNVSAVLPSVMDLWTTKVTAYSDFAKMAEHFGMTSYFMLFESFILDPKAAVSQALNAFGITAEGVKKIDASTKLGGKNLTEAQRFYRDENWKLRLTRTSVAQINALLDVDLVKSFGYPILNPADFPQELPELEQRRFSYEMMALDPEPSWEKPNQQVSHGKACATATT